MEMWRKTKVLLETWRKRTVGLFDVVSESAEPGKTSNANGGGAIDPPAINKWNSKAYSPRYHEILKKRKALPVWQLKDDFLQALHANQILILIGEPGSGKSTQIPQFVVEAIDMLSPDKQMVACTQPERVAAMSISKRVAEEMDVSLGAEVGYIVPFENCSNEAKTVLKYFTDELLLREAMEKPSLEKYKAIIIDEVHEKTIATELLLGLLPKYLGDRPDMKLVVMSAYECSFDKYAPISLKGYFSDAVVMNVPKRLRKVEVEITYATKDPSDYLEAAIEKAFEIHCSQPPGDILVFLSRKEEIKAACKKLTKEVADARDRVGPVNIVPLYSTLSQQKQQKVFEATPPAARDGIPVRKIVISTSIAESSLTIDNIIYVIDSGFAMHNVFLPELRVHNQIICSISKATIDRVVREERSPEDASGSTLKVVSTDFYVTRNRR